MRAQSRLLLGCIFSLLILVNRIPLFIGLESSRRKFLDGTTKTMTFRETKIIRVRMHILIVEFSISSLSMRWLCIFLLSSMPLHFNALFVNLYLGCDCSRVKKMINIADMSAVLFFVMYLCRDGFQKRDSEKMLIGVSSEY